MIDLEKRTIERLYAAGVTSYSEHPALNRTDGTGYTYGQVADVVQNMQIGLAGLNLRRGDRVALLGESSPEWAMAYLAITTVGAVAVPIMPDFHVSEIRHILRNSGSRLAFVSERLYPKIADAEIRNLESLICLDDAVLQPGNFQVTTWSEFLQKKLPKKKTATDKKRQAEIEEDDLAEILYTSGTTGHSKGVMLSHRNIVSNALSGINFIGVTQNDRLLSILPISHAYECTQGFLAPFMRGASIYYLRGLPAVHNLLPALKRIKPTIILAVPLIMEKILRKAENEINARRVTKNLYRIRPLRKAMRRKVGDKLQQLFGGELQFMIMGGAATSLEVEEFLSDARFPYITGYGLTEASPLVAVNPVGKVKHQSVGQAIPEVRLRILNSGADSQVGEIAIKGPNIMRGYYRNEAATLEALTRDGWLKTGDLGSVDQDGYLFIQGRSKNVIVGPSGENIFPEQIEEKIMQSPWVSECLVYENNRSLEARVHLDYEKIDTYFNTQGLDESEASKLTKRLLNEIRQEVNGQIASFARLRVLIEQTEEFEKTPTQKIKRYLYAGRPEGASGNR